MKKTLIALAAVAVSSAAMAQATISGTFGAAQQSYTSAGVKEKGFAQTDASIRFTASEDLGDGLRASAFGQFTMGSQRGVSTTSGLTKEDSGITLSGGFGSITYANTRTSDTGIAAMVFSSSLPRTSWYDTVSARAASDVISYTTPAIMPGLTVGISSSEIGLTSAGVLNNADGILTNGSTASTTGFKVTTVSLNYAQGPLVVRLAQKSTNLTAAMVRAGAEKNNTEAAITYNLGVAQVGVAYDSKTTTTGKALTGYGINIPVGKFAIGANSAKRGDNKFTEYGVNYALSKRTIVRANFGKMSGVTSNSATTSTIGKQSRIGVTHTF